MSVHAGGGARSTRRVRPLVVVGSLIWSASLLVVAPVMMIVISRLRFDDANPLFGMVSSPSVASLVSWVTDGSEPVRLDGVIIDVIVAAALSAGWISLLVVTGSVMLEVLARLRHGGGEGPARRGPPWSQRLVGYLASGLVALISQAGLVRAVELPVASVAVEVSSIVTADTVELSGAVPPGWPTVDPVGSNAADSEQIWARHQVAPGESVLSIAQDYARGREPLAVAYLILEANLGAAMPDGSMFTSPAVIEPGWEFSVPVVSGIVGSGSDDIGLTHIVEPGDTLWDLADRYLDDPRRWPEIFDANAARVFSDGRTFDDPDLILPGWDLVIGDASSVVDGGTSVAEVQSEASETGSVDGLESQMSSQEEAEDMAAATNSPVPGFELDDGVDVVSDDEVVADAPQASAPSASGSSADESPSTDTAERPMSSGTDTAEMMPADRIDTPAMGWSASTEDRPGSATSHLVRTGFQIAAGAGATMLVGALVAAFAGRRRQQLRSLQGRLGLISGGAGDLERAVDAAAAIPRVETHGTSVMGEPFMPSDVRTDSAVSVDDVIVRLDLALRALARVVAPSGAGAVMALVGSDGGVAVRLDRRAPEAADWSVEGLWWTLPASVDLEYLAELAQGVAMPSMAMVQLGRDANGASVFIDLETVGLFSVISDASSRSDAVVAALGACLAGSEFSDGVSMAAVSIDEAIFLGRRSGFVAESIPAAAAMQREREALAASAFSLRARATGGERWEPLVVFAGSHRPAADGPDEMVVPAGVALVVSGSDPQSRLNLREAGTWWEVSGPLLDGESLLIETNLIHEDGIVALRSCFTDPRGDVEAESDGGYEHFEHSAASDVAVVPEMPQASQMDSISPPLDVEATWRFMVRLLGPVDVVTPDGETVTFERSRSVELLAWLVTHRHHATRMGARTAIWEVDVRNSTFSNVVSDVRRGLSSAAGVEPQDWIAYGTGDDLVLHQQVCSDAEVLNAALESVEGRCAEEVIELLSPAVALVRSLPFSTTRFLWPDPEGITTTLIMSAISASTRLAEAYLELGDDAGVYRATEAGLAVIPGHEELIALRLRAHGRSGDHAGLRTEWDAYRRALERDRWADSEPSWRLVELRNELLGVDPASSVPPERR